MDNLSIHLGAMRRRYPAELQVRSIGWVPEKRSVVNKRFDSVNFSFILRGKGFYEWDGNRQEIEAPCVITQWPGAVTHYAPDDSWEECFLIYETSLLPALTERGYYAEHRHWWALEDTGALQQPLQELFDLIRRPDPETQVDRIDRCCDRLITESLLAAGSHSAQGPEATVRAIRHLVDTHPDSDHDFEALAEERGLSSTHFRRLWRRMIGTPPSRYLQHLRLRQACRRLVETQRPIGEIAAELGFSDQLYFARRFKSFTGMPASTYRQRFRYDLSLVADDERETSD